MSDAALTAPAPVVAPDAGGLWFAYPDYSHENPFQTLLYSAFPERWQVRGGDADTAIAALAAGRKPVVFHLHWEDIIYRDAPALAEAEEMVAKFLARLDEISQRGGILLWTVHNEEPHEPRHPGLDRSFRREIAARAHTVHMHSRLAAETMAPALGIDPATVLVTKLGAFAGYYPDDISRAAARRHFGIAETAPVFVSLGALRAYKGVDLVVAAFAEVQQAVPDARLILAGRGGAPTARRFQEIAPGVTLLGRYIDDCTVQYVMRAADWAVFAFRRVMVSSSVLLPPSFGIPVIVPDLPTLREMLAPNGFGRLYPAGSVDGLAAALLDAIAVTPQERTRLEATCAAEVRERDNRDYVAALLGAVAAAG